MAINSTPRRRLGVAFGVVLTGVAAGLIGFAGVASAHTPKINAECKGETTTLNVKLAAYNGKNANTIEVTDNGANLDKGEFRESYEHKFDVSGAVDHSFTVVVGAWDDKSGKNGWSFTQTIDVKACVTAPPTSETTTTEEVPPTTETTTSEAPPETTTSEVAPVVDTTSPAPPAAQGGPLAETGASIALPLGIAGVLIVGGVGALFVVRRRGKASQS